MLTKQTTPRLTLLLLLFFFGQLVLSAPQLSLTADEPVHIVQGYLYWTRGDFRFQRPVAQPPLADILEGALLVLQPGPQPETLAGWETAELTLFSRDFVAWYGDSLPAATCVARFPITLIALLGAAFVFRWAREWFGRGGALLALALLTLDPNFAAHANLATTDLLLAVWSFIAVYAGARWVQRPHNWRQGALTGLALGLALGSKTSGFFPLGIVGVLCLAQAVTQHYQKPAELFPALLRWGARLAAVVLLALLVLWTLYRFEFHPLPGSQFPLPFPTQWIIWGELQTHLREGHIAYLMGERSYTGWWYYYPIAFLLKTPLPTLLLLGAALVTRLTSARRGWWQRRALWLTPLLYSLAAITSTIDIGYRYLLIMLPFLYILVGGLYPLLKQRWQRVAVLGMLLWSLGENLNAFPHYLAYFNNLTRHTQTSHRYLVDSNLDWGQGFIALHRWLAAHPSSEPLYLSYYTFAAPELYGIAYTPLAPAPDAPPVLAQCFDPPPGRYALSATTLQGVMVSAPDTYDWFRHREPAGRPGQAIFVYDVPTPEATPDWIAQCTVPVTPLTTDVIVSGFGRSDLRTVAFDCTSSWVYPGGGTRPGWYALPSETTKEDTFIQRRLAPLKLSYEQHQAAALPPFQLYQLTTPPTTPRFTPEKTLHIGPLRFLGYQTTLPDKIQAGEILEINTYWQVQAEVSSRPLSIMLHLIGPEGAVVEVGDGLGYPPTTWQVGDVFIQRHQITLPAGTSPGVYRANTGVYWLADLSRWLVRENGTEIGDHIPLTLPLVIE
ncbi:MAG TPA: phospholipid carrier-dependent glycosyltransferase [Thermoflexia bacterium]|nr:phospholipid carrier-dependent glycosyltransferase [Thermoflexia bacterium]